MIIGLIEFIFNMYLSRIFGAEGLGLLSLVSPINCLFLSFMTEGVGGHHIKNIGETPAFPKLCRDGCQHQNLHGIQFFVVPVPGGRRFLTAKPIATWFLGDSSLTYTILATCPLMILMSISNIVKGHFLGLAKIKVPSAINISEKILRFPILYCLIKFCLNKTSFPPVTLIYLCYAIGEMQSVLFLMIYYKKTKPKVPPLKMKFELVGSTLKPLIKGATPICLTQCLMEFVNAFFLRYRKIEALLHRLHCR